MLRQYTQRERSFRSQRYLAHLVVSHLPSVALTHSVSRYAPKIDPTSSSAYPIEIMRMLRLAAEAAPAIVAALHEAQKTVPDQSLRSKRAEGQYCPRSYGISFLVHAGGVLPMIVTSNASSCENQPDANAQGSRDG
jgi:hypothetical protein